MKNKLLMLITFLIGFGSFGLLTYEVKVATPVQNPPKVLLVYDSLNERNERQEDVQTLG